MEERPLARKQEALEGSGNDSMETQASGGEVQGAPTGDVTVRGASPVGGKALLRDDDRELERVYSVCFIPALQEFVILICEVQ